MPTEYRNMIFHLVEYLQRPSSAVEQVLTIAGDLGFEAAWLEKPKKGGKKRNLGTSVDPTLQQMLYCRSSYNILCNI